MDAAVDGSRASVKVWTPSVRLFHWALVTAVATAWLTADEVKSVHEWAGYVVAALIVFRLLQGFVGGRYARFAQFVRGPAASLAYLRDVLAGRERRYLGHNPAGAIMVLTLLAVLAGIAFTGWLQTTDAYWGIAWVKEVHEFLANGILVLIALHVGGVILASLRHRENLVRAMLTGWKRAPESGDVS